MTDPTELHLLRTIIKNPADDTARLVYADWLDEHGRAERAEFIRVQCELERCDVCSPRQGTWWDWQCGHRPAHERVQELQEQHGREWARVPCVTCVKGYEKHPTTGEVIEQWCRSCDRTGDAMQREGCTPHFRRGFVERVEVPGLAWLFEHKRFVRRREPSPISFLREPEDAIITPPPPLEEYYEWRVTEWAKAVGAAHPVTEFVIGDREPRRHYYMQGEIGADWLLDADTPADEGSVIPQPIYDRIASDLMYMREKGFSRGQWEQSREAALSALAIAAADVVREAVLKMWAREQVGVSSTAP